MDIHGLFRHAVTSSHVRKSINHLIKPDWIIPHANASRVVDRVRDRRSDAADAKLAYPLRFHWRRHRVHFVEEDDLLMRDVRMHRDHVADEVTRPSLPSRTRAPDFVRSLLRKAAATPMPTSQRPSRVDPGTAWRLLQPNFSAPTRMHSTSCRCEHDRLCQIGHETNQFMAKKGWMSEINPTIEGSDCNNVALHRLPMKLGAARKKLN